jgi:hypothetical protein
MWRNKILEKVKNEDEYIDIKRKLEEVTAERDKLLQSIKEINMVVEKLKLELCLKSAN